MKNKRKEFDDRNSEVVVVMEDGREFVFQGTKSSTEEQVGLFVKIAEAFDLKIKNLQEKKIQQ